MDEIIKTGRHHDISTRGWLPRSFVVKFKDNLIIDRTAIHIIYVILLIKCATLNKNNAKTTPIPKSKAGEVS